MDKELIQKSLLQYGNLRDSAKSLNIGYSTLRYWIKKHQIPYDSKRGRKCISDGKKYKNIRDKAIKRKLEYINQLGNKCSCCGYNKNWSALEFHHIDPSQKKIKLDLKELTRSSKEMLDMEVKKCKLVCSNCHREIHNPDKNFIVP